MPHRPARCDRRPGTGAKLELPWGVRDRSGRERKRTWKITRFQESRSRFVAARRSDRPAHRQTTTVWRLHDDELCSSVVDDGAT